MKVWEGKPVVGFSFTWGLLWSQLQQQNKAKYHFLIRYIGAQSDLTQVMTLKQKVNWTKEISLKVNCEQWQFYGTVYVISWTVNTVLSIKRRKFVNLEHVFVSFQDFVGKTRNFSAGVVARFGREEGYIEHGVWT